MSLHRAHYVVLDESSLLAVFGRWFFWPTLSFGWTEAPDKVENNTCCWNNNNCGTKVLIEFDSTNPGKELHNMLQNIYTSQS